MCKNEKQEAVSWFRVLAMLRIYINTTTARLMRRATNWAKWTVKIPVQYS
jgi:hypothetical protein